MGSEVCKNMGRQSLTMPIATMLVSLCFFLSYTALAAEALSLRWITTHDVAMRLMPELSFQGRPTLMPVLSEGLDLKAPPLVILAGVALLPSIANALVTAYRNLLYGGLVVEVEGGDLVIRNDRRLPYGTLLVVDGDVVVYRVDELPDSSALVTSLTELVARTGK